MKLRNQLSDFVIMCVYEPCEGVRIKWSNIYFHYITSFQALGFAVFSIQQCIFLRKNP